jgi:hypothetical protein
MTTAFCTKCRRSGLPGGRGQGMCEFEKTSIRFPGGEKNEVLTLG